MLPLVSGGLASTGRGQEVEDGIVDGYELGSPDGLLEGNTGEDGDDVGEDEKCALGVFDGSNTSEGISDGLMEGFAEGGVEGSETGPFVG